MKTTENQLNRLISFVVGAFSIKKTLTKSNNNRPFGALSHSLPLRRVATIHLITASDRPCQLVCIIMHIIQKGYIFNVNKNWNHVFDYAQDIRKFRSFNRFVIIILQIPTACLVHSVQSVQSVQSGC